MEHSHISSRFDKKHEKLKSGILNMGALVVAQLEAATQILQNADDDAVKTIVKTDRKVNGMYKSTYSRAERLIALQQPMALDLRQALIPISLANELERVGDHAKGLAKRASELAKQNPNAEIIAQITSMSTMVQTMLNNALSAYADSNLELALTTRSSDSEIDKINKSIYDLAMAAINKTPDQAQSYFNLILIAGGLERVGDHAANMARYVEMIVTGEDPKASS